MKRIDVESLLHEVNRMLASNTCGRDVRLGMCHVLEIALHRAKRYRGFQYLTAAQVMPGVLPGIVRGATPDLHLFPDDSRRVYY